MHLVGDGPNTVSESTVSNTKLSEFIGGSHRVPNRELSDFLSAYCLCAKANSPSSSQNSPSLPQKNSLDDATEQAKANLDPRVSPQVGPRVAPRVGPRVAPRVAPREHPRGLISLFSALQRLPTKHPTKVSTEGPTSGRSGFICPVFTCSVL